MHRGILQSARNGMDTPNEAQFTPPPSSVPRSARPFPRKEAKRATNSYPRTDGRRIHTEPAMIPRRKKRGVGLCRIRVLRIRESGSLANFDSWRPITPGLLAKRPSKRPEKDPKNRFTGPDFENTESNRGSWVLILRIRYSSITHSSPQGMDKPLNSEPRSVPWIKTPISHKIISDSRVS